MARALIEDASGEEAAILEGGEQDNKPLVLDLSGEARTRLAHGLTVLWAGLVCFSFLSFVVGVRFGDCERGTPGALFCVTALLMLLSVLAQAHFLKCGGRGLGTQLRFLLHCGLGAAELLDFFTDGQQVAQALLCDDRLHGALVETWARSAVPFLATPVRALHLYGLLTLAVILALVAQVFTACMAEEVRAGGRLLVLANFLGLGGLQDVLQRGEGEHLDKLLTSLLRAISVGLFEVVPSLYLQTSLFGLSFAHTSGAAKAKQLLSLLLSSLGLLKLLGAAPTAIREAKTIETRLQVVFLGHYVLFCLAVLALLLVCALRVAHAFSCPAHLWNLTTGCVA